MIHFPIDQTSKRAFISEGKAGFLEAEKVLKSGSMMASLEEVIYTWIQSTQFRSQLEGKGRVWVARLGLKVKEGQYLIVPNHGFLPFKSGDEPEKLRFMDRSTIAIICPGTGPVSVSVDEKKRLRISAAEDDKDSLEHVAGIKIYSDNPTPLGGILRN